MPHPHPTLARALPLLLAVACRDAPTQPGAERATAALAPHAATTLALAPEETAALAASIDDAVTRLLPAVAPSDGDGLADAVRAVDAALGRGDAAELRRAIGRARRALGRAHAPSDARADLDAVGLVLDRAAAALPAHAP